MTLKEKQELVRLLNAYQAELIEANNCNIKEAQNHTGKKWEGEYKCGVKAQYGHARIIATKLSNEIGKEMKSYWEL